MSVTPESRVQQMPSARAGDDVDGLPSFQPLRPRSAEQPASDPCGSLETKPSGSGFAAALQHDPFLDVPRADLFYTNSAIRETYAGMWSAVAERNGLFLLTAEEGCGTTAL